MLILYIADVEKDVDMKNLSRKEALRKGEKMDTVSRQAAIDAVVGCTNCGTEDVLREYVIKHSLENGWTGGIVDALDAIEQLPSAQPERIKGHWIAITSWNNTYKCSVCGRLLVNITDGKNKVAKNYPYCHCGADMRGEIR